MVKQNVLLKAWPNVEKQKLQGTALHIKWKWYYNNINAKVMAKKLWRWRLIGSFHKGTYSHIKLILSVNQFTNRMSVMQVGWHQIRINSTIWGSTGINEHKLQFQVPLTCNIIPILYWTLSMVQGIFEIHSICEFLLLCLLKLSNVSHTMGNVWCNSDIMNQPRA